MFRRVGAMSAVLQLLWSACACAAESAYRADPQALLSEMRAAAGTGWGAAYTLKADGHKTSFGLTGAFHADENVRTGQFARRATYPLFENAEGLDSAGRWRMDNSGGIHPLDSDEARAVARTEAFLTRRDYLAAGPAETIYAALPPETVEGQTFDRLSAEPSGGRAVVLWVRRSDHLLARAVIPRSNRSETIRYGDYRRVGNLELPFTVEVANGDQSETGIARIEKYGLVSTEAPPRPAPRRDFALAGPAAHAWMGLDLVSGFPMVEARVNDSGPLLFILDTAGHDILTPQAVKALGLTSKGKGFSLGAGAGTTATQFTKVERLRVGEAELREQPFLVLDINLGQAAGSDGQRAPVVGLIGLELFERFAATLDYQGHELRLCRFADASPAVGAPIRFSDDAPLAEGALDGRKGWFNLDTGNNQAVIVFKSWADAVGLSPTLVGATAGGSSVGGTLAFKSAKGRKLSLAGGEVTAPDLLLAGENMGTLSARAEAGNIGETVFSRFTVSFDYHQARVALEPAGAAGRCPGR
jgi:hypothetical protein